MLTPLVIRYLRSYFVVFKTFTRLHYSAYLLSLNYYKLKKEFKIITSKKLKSIKVVKNVILERLFHSKFLLEKFKCLIIILYLHNATYITIILTLQVETKIKNDTPQNTEWPMFILKLHVPGIRL